MRIDMHDNGTALAQRVERVSIDAAVGLRDVSITVCLNEFPGRITTEMRSHEMCSSKLKDERRVVVRVSPCRAGQAERKCHSGRKNYSPEHHRSPCRGCWRPSQRSRPAKSEIYSRFPQFALIAKKGVPLLELQLVASRRTGFRSAAQSPRITT